MIELAMLDKIDDLCAITEALSKFKKERRIAKAVRRWVIAERYEHSSICPACGAQLWGKDGHTDDCPVLELMRILEP